MTVISERANGLNLKLYQAGNWFMFTTINVSNIYTVQEETLNPDNIRNMHDERAAYYKGILLPHIFNIFDLITGIILEQRN